MFCTFDKLEVVLGVGFFCATTSILSSDFSRGISHIFRRPMRSLGRPRPWYLHTRLNLSGFHSQPFLLSEHMGAAVGCYPGVSRSLIDQILLIYDYTELKVRVLPTHTMINCF